MRTTLRLDNNVMSQLRLLAAQTHRTLTSIIEDAVREILIRHQKKHSRASVRLPSFRGKGLQPGVDLDHTAGLLDLMENK